MLRHRLAALFEPRSLLLVSDDAVPELPLPSAGPRALPAWRVPVRAGMPLALPDTLLGLTSGARLDLVVACLPPGRLDEALAALAPLRPRCVLLLRHPEPPADDQAALRCRAWARAHDCAVIGPGSYGLQRPRLSLNFSHEPVAAPPGRAALVAQSGSLVAGVLDWARDVRLGFSAVLSLGDESDVDVADLLDYLAMDRDTDSIVLYIESVSSARRFASALRTAASVKPVIVLMPDGATPRAQAAQPVLDALLRRVGAVRVRYIVQLFSALKVLGHARRPQGRRVAVLSNGEGVARLALGVMGENTSLRLAELSDATRQALARVLAEPQPAGPGLPVLMRAPLRPEVLTECAGLLAADAGVDGVLILLSPDPLGDLAGATQALAGLVRSLRKPVLTCLLGDDAMRSLRHVLDAVGAPAFRSPETAAHAFSVLATHHYNQTLSRQTLPPEPLALPPRLDEARGLLRALRQEGRRQLGAGEAARLLACFHVPVQLAVDEAGKYADEGGSAGDRLARGSAAQGLSARGSPARDHAPGGSFAGGFPLAIVAEHHAGLGPCLSFGAGGPAALLTRHDRAIEMPPLNGYLARQLVQRSRVWRQLLSGQAGPAMLELLSEALERVSELVSELPEIDRLSLDPLHLRDGRLVADGLDVSLRPGGQPDLPEAVGYPHMAIHPYPRRLVKSCAFADGATWQLRPIRPEDAEALQAFVRDLSPQARYMRFVSMLRELTSDMLARYTRIDYDRELALVATVPVPDPAPRGGPGERIIGFAHYLRNADGQGAEYALVISDDWQRHGLGTQLMQALIEAARRQGLSYIDGYVLASNRPMLALMQRLGFQNDADPEDPSLRRVWLDLQLKDAADNRSPE